MKYPKVDYNINITVWHTIALKFCGKHWIARIVMAKSIGTPPEVFKQNSQTFEGFLI